MIGGERETTKLAAFSSLPSMECDIVHPDQTQAGQRRSSSHDSRVAGERRVHHRSEHFCRGLRQARRGISANMITARELLLVVQSGVATPEQWAALQKAQEFAAQVGVTLNITQVP